MAAFDYFLSVTGDCSSTSAGAISLSLTGGTAPYTIEWVDPDLGVIITTDKVFIRGWGVDTRLNGNLKISGDNNLPIVKGILNTVRGRYQEFGKILTIRKGELIFDGPLSPSPFLNIIGVYVNRGTEIRLILSG